jgi:hypothetical protein
MRAPTIMMATPSRPARTREVRFRPHEAAFCRRIGAAKPARELASYEARGYEMMPPLKGDHALLDYLFASSGGHSSSAQLWKSQMRVSMAALDPEIGCEKSPLILTSLAQNSVTCMSWCVIVSK